MSAAQILRQAEALKSAAGDVAKGSPEAWVSRQNLQDLYQRLLIMDLEYALDKKVEQDLWNHAFKNQITTFQNQTKDKSNPKRVEVQATLTLFLDMASGFYLQLFQELSSAFKLDLPMRKRPQSFGIIKSLQAGYTRMAMPKKSSSLYICQYCLVHLGDIARYRQQVDQAQTYYRHAASVVPYNGQPYNQLAILEAAKGNKLSTVFYYVRSIAVKHPFPVASTNLEKLYTKIVRDVNEYRNKLSVNEVISVFLQFHALLHHCSDLDRARLLSERLSHGLSSHIPSSFSAYQLVQMTTVNLFALNHAKRKLDLGGKDPAEEGRNGQLPEIAVAEQLSSDEKRSYHMIFDILLHTMDAILQCSPKQEVKLKEHHTLPALKVILDWLCTDEETLQQPLFNKYSGIWPNLAKTLNNLQFSQQDVTPPTVKKFCRFPLPEDRDLQCFVPLAKAHKDLDFVHLTLEGVPEMVEPYLRQQRLTQHGLWLAEEFPSLNILNVHKYKSGRLEFTATTPQVKLVPGESDGILETRTIRQNVAIQAIMQNRAKMSSQSPPAGGDALNIEKSKSEPMIRISAADLEVKKKTTGNVNGNQSLEVKMPKPMLSQNTDNFVGVNARAVGNGILLESKQARFANVWDSASETSLSLQQEPNLKIHPEVPPTITTNHLHSNGQAGSRNVGYNHVSPSKMAVGSVSPGSNDAWSNKSSPNSSDAAMKSESETRYSNIQQSTPGNHSFGYPPFRPLSFPPDFQAVRCQMQNSRGQQQPPYRPAEQQSAVLQMDMIRTSQQMEPRHQQPAARPMNVNQPQLVSGLRYSQGGLGPRPSFGAWSNDPRAMALQAQQRMNMNSQGCGSPWNNQARPVNHWGTAIAPPTSWDTSPTAGDCYRPVNEVSEGGVDQSFAPQSLGAGGAGIAQTGVRMSVTPPRPIGPSPNQLPLPNFKAPLPGTASMVSGTLPPRAPVWEGPSPQQITDPTLHPMIRQLFQSATYTPPNAMATQQSGSTEQQQHMVNGTPTTMNNNNNTIPTVSSGNHANHMAPPPNRFPMIEGQHGNFDPLQENKQQLHSVGPTFEAISPGVARERQRYASSSEKVAGVIGGVESTSEKRRHSEGGDMPPYSGRDTTIPGSPMSNSPGRGSLFLGTPDSKHYPSPSSGTYSLFNSQSPWSLPINKDAHSSHCSSPFGSSTASNRTSPDHFSADERSPNMSTGRTLGNTIGQAFGLPVSSAEGAWPVSSQQPVGNSQNTQPPSANILGNNLQTLWSGPSALERLLEAQRKQKSDPH